jgi:hypothetical protein
LIDRLAMDDLIKLVLRTYARSARLLLCCVDAWLCDGGDRRPSLGDDDARRLRALFDAYRGSLCTPIAGCARTLSLLYASIHPMPAGRPGRRTCGWRVDVRWGPARQCNLRFSIHSAHHRSICVRVCAGTGACRGGRTRTAARTWSCRRMTS